MDWIKAAFGSFSVDDVEAAREFYGGTLGLVVREVAPGAGGPFFVTAGKEPTGPSVFVYAKPDHQPATFTVLHLAVADIDAAVDELGTRGVEMQRVDGIPQDDRGIYRADGHSIAWFADPAGNSVAVASLSAMA